MPFYDPSMSRDDPQMKIRLPVGLKASIEDSSIKNNRTLNAEIVARLQQSFEPSRDIIRDDAFQSVLETVLKEFRELKQAMAERR